MSAKKRVLFPMAVVAGVLLTIAPLTAQDWLRFRGPNGNGVSESSVPTEWSPDSNLAWKTKMPGAGCSSPIVVGDKVFVTCYSGYGESRTNVGEKNSLRRHVVCVDRKTGKTIWEKAIPAAENEDNFTGIGVTAHGYASHTPVSDGKNLFVFLGKSGVFAFDLDGKELWNKKVGDGSDSRKWGSASSPVVCDDLLIVPALAESRAVFGLKKSTGEQVWKCESKAMDNTWATPSVIKVSDTRKDVVLGVPDELWAINPKTGKLAWAVGNLGSDSFYTSTVVKDDVIYASAGGRSGGGSIAVRSGGKKDVTDSHTVWNSRVTGSFASPIIHKGLMFVIGRGGVMQVADVKTGKSVGKVRLKATADSTPKNAGGSGGGFGSPDYGSPVLAGGKIYYTKGNGVTFVMNADASSEVIAVNKLTDDAEIFSGTPAVSGGRMFIRSNKYLYCIGE